MSKAKAFVPRIGLLIAASLAVAVPVALAHGHRRHSHRPVSHSARGADSRYSAWDEEYLKTSIEGDRFEIQGGNLAQQRGTNDAVRNLGARLVKDHTQSLAEAIDVAQRLGIEVPSSPSPSEQWELATLGWFQGNDFNNRYSSLEVNDHQQDIQETQDEIDKGSNSEVRNLASQDLPMLQEHLRLSQDAL